MSENEKWYTVVLIGQGARLIKLRLERENDATDNTEHKDSQG